VTYQFVARHCDITADAAKQCVRGRVVRSRRKRLTLLS
jgi:hypothetical protein